MKRRGNGRVYPFEVKLRLPDGRKTSIFSETGDKNYIRKKAKKMKAKVLFIRKVDHGAFLHPLGVNKFKDVIG